MGLLAILADATRTTITTTTGAVTTTVQTGTTLGSGANGGSSAGPWRDLLNSTELWAALLGALIGGAATAVGSYILHRIQSKKDVRSQMYTDLLPNVAHEYEVPRLTIEGLRVGTLRGPVAPPTIQLTRHLGTLRRAGAIVGGKEAQITSEIWNLMHPSMGYESYEGTNKDNRAWRVSKKDLPALVVLR
jgi:hypothetical protein